MHENIEKHRVKRRRVFMLKKTMLFLLPVISVMTILSSALACEFQFELTLPDGSIRRITPDQEVGLELGETYTLEVRFIPDHRRCETPPEATLYLMQEEKWKTGKDNLPLGLVSMSAWEEAAEARSGAWEQVLGFEASMEGDWALQILRDCTRGGYDESLHFQVR
jgi:hypothetical protein